MCGHLGFWVADVIQLVSSGSCTAMYFSNISGYHESPLQFYLHRFYCDSREHKLSLTLKLIYPYEMIGFMQSIKTNKEVVSLLGNGRYRKRKRKVFNTFKTFKTFKFLNNEFGVTTLKFGFGCLVT